MDKGMSLYMISEGFFDIYEKLETGEISEKEADEAYEKMGEMLRSKSTGIVAYARNVDAGVTAVDAEIKRLQQLKKGMEDRKEKYMQYVKGCMERLGLTKIETAIGTMAITKNPLSVEIEDIDRVPKEYRIVEAVLSGDEWEITNAMAELAGKGILDKINVKRTTTARKNDIKDHFKETGEIFPGVKMLLDKTTIRIK